MSLLEHLLEVRKRFVLVAVGLVLGAVLGWYAYDPLMELLQAPLKEASEARDIPVTLNFTGLTAALDTKIKVSLFLAVFLTCPWWLYQFWAFVTPGLTSKERRYAFGFVGAAVPLFLAGAFMAWLVLPHAVGILTGFVPDDTSNFNNAQEYLSFVMRLILAFGLSFVSPVILVALNFAGIVQGKSLLAGWRWAVLIAFTFAAIITPTPDALTMILVALPICLLFFGAVGIAIMHDRQVERRYADVA
ncbi:twin-arginine translocase subunit TatC [Antribacter gilvus]|uniref:twin-arginine translocase subunit TatC n=1 Tax=Antribacter gilvus TaxID=2304675 RepID=UPI000F778387|nr:twin-arginine translocase subunit TatC [Antribacter gilvus]